jgi:hypothetical protein
MVQSPLLNPASIGALHLFAVHVPVDMHPDGQDHLGKVGEDRPVSQKREEVFRGEEHKAHDGAEETQKESNHFDEKSDLMVVVFGELILGVDEDQGSQVDVHCIFSETVVVFLIPFRKSPVQFAQNFV